MFRSLLELSPAARSFRRAEKSQSFQPLVSDHAKAFNFIGCIAACYLLVYLTFYSALPLTLDMILTISLAEYCRLASSNEQQRAFVRKDSKTNGSARNSINQLDRFDTIASVVGYREDPSIFARALESYRNAKNCKLLLVCIDGDAKEDQEMISVFQKVYPKNSALLHIDTPFAQIAAKKHLAGSGAATDTEIIDQCVAMARGILERSKINLQGPNAVTKLCVSQKHMHKKGIMFTSMILSLAISEIIGVEYVWTSDSDSMISNDTLTRTMSLIAGDPQVAGASTALYIHNKNESILTELGNAIYLNELYLARSFSGSVKANDCQSGPCAAFRLSAVRPELFSWYEQRVWGHWMVTNEDRHLTTRLLRTGWKVVFAPDILTATESPTTLRRWLLQQIRWARAVHIESMHQPSVYIMQSPVLFFGALRRLVAVLLLPAIVMWYFYTGRLIVEVFSLSDYLIRTVITMAYLILRNPYRPTSMKEWLWCVPANLFYNITWPAIQIWSMATVLDDSWGTTMRTKRERARCPTFLSKLWDVGFVCLWLGIVGGAIGRYIAANWALDAQHESALVVLGTLPTWGALTWWIAVTN